MVYKVTAKTNKEITDVVKAANYADACAGIITWCHTFSPSKMWINGLANLQKPYCHLATQYNLEIPNDEIDMDFMNLNQAAHGDREHGFIAARLRMPRKVIAGYWKEEKVHKRLGDWMKAAVGVAVSKNLKVMHFGDKSADDIPAVLVNSHGPFAWGTDPHNAVHNAVVLEELAFMAYHTQAISPDTKVMQQELLDKHYLRKHGKNAYYGQN